MNNQPYYYNSEYYDENNNNNCNSCNSNIPSYTQNKPTNNNVQGIFCVCSAKVICFLSTILAFTLGLILGAVLVVIVLLALPALIVLAVVLAILIIALLIFRYCSCCKSKKCN